MALRKTAPARIRQNASKASERSEQANLGQKGPRQTASCSLTREAQQSLLAHPALPVEGATRAPKNAARELARVICVAALDIKAEDLKILDVRKLSGFTDYLVIASGLSGRQVKAMSDHLQGMVHKKYGKNPMGVEGQEQASWILIDYGDVVVHLFQAEARSFYRLEELWYDAPRVKFRLNA